MAKAHINPETGEVGRCGANVKCPFGGESGEENHYPTLKAAREESARREALNNDPFVSLTKQQLNLRNVGAGDLSGSMSPDDLKTAFKQAKKITDESSFKVESDAERLRQAESALRAAEEKVTSWQQRYDEAEGNGNLRRPYGIQLNRAKRELEAARVNMSTFEHARDDAGSINYPNAATVERIAQEQEKQADDELEAAILAAEQKVSEWQQKYDAAEGNGNLRRPYGIHLNKAKRQLENLKAKRR